MKQLCRRVGTASALILALTALVGGSAQGGLVHLWWYSAGNFQNCSKSGFIPITMTCQSPGYAPRQYIQQYSMVSATHDLRYYYTNGTLGGVKVTPDVYYSALNSPFSYGLTYSTWAGSNPNLDDTDHYTTN